MHHDSSERDDIFLELKLFILENEANENVCDENIYFHSNENIYNNDFTMEVSQTSSLQEFHFALLFGHKYHRV